MKRKWTAHALLALMISLLVLGLWAPMALAAGTEFPDTNTSKANILMDASTGMVLSEKNSNERLPMASLTKVMTLILTFEAIDREELMLETMGYRQ